MSILGRTNNPYPNDNESTISDFLEELILLVSKEKELQPILGNEGFQDITVSNTVVALTVPEQAVSASIFCEAARNSDPVAPLIRFKENGENPSSNSGQILYDRFILNPSGRENLVRLRFFGLGNGHFLRVQYYASNQLNNRGSSTNNSIL